MCKHIVQLSGAWPLPTLLLLKGCPEQVDGRFSGKVGAAGLLVDVSHNVSVVALYIFCILQSRRERASWRRCRGRAREKEQGRKKGKKKKTTCLKPIFSRTTETLNFFIDKIVF